jgi:hypothetical protein
VSIFWCRAALRRPRHRGFELRPDLVDGAISLADRLPHHGLASGLLHAIDRILDGRRKQARHTGENRLSHQQPPLETSCRH